MAWVVQEHAGLWHKLSLEHKTTAQGIAVSALSQLFLCSYTVLLIAHLQATSRVMRASGHPTRPATKVGAGSLDTVNNSVDVEYQARGSESGPLL